MNCKRLFLLAAVMAFTSMMWAAGKVELPFTLCGQKVYRVDSLSKKTVGREIVDAYRLVGVVDSGDVYYMPQKQALLLDNAVIDYRRKTCVIQCRDEVPLTLIIRGENHITSIGSVLNAAGSVTIYGEGIDKSMLCIHGLHKKGYKPPMYGLFTRGDMMLSDLTFNADGFANAFYGKTIGDKQTTLLLERVQSDIVAQGYKPCVAKGFNYMQMCDCGPSREQHGNQFIRYYGNHLQQDGENCCELHLVADGGQQPTSPDRVIEQTNNTKIPHL